MESRKKEKILVLGSCFASNIASRLEAEGFEVLCNPFGTLFNPVSIKNSLDRLRSGEPFTASDCVQIGAGSTLWGSFHHYTKCARQTPEEFLEDANRSLEQASDFYRSCTMQIITFGTAWCFRSLERGMVVSNCLKRPAREFERFRLRVEDIVGLYASPERRTVFTVSPIRHLADTAHGNQLSKSTLLLAIDELIARHPEHYTYFPAYEILLDDLRDYRWYADDKVHPSADAVEIICNRFLETLNENPFFIQ